MRKQEWVPLSFVPFVCKKNVKELNQTTAAMLTEINALKLYLHLVCSFQGRFEKAR